MSWPVAFHSEELGSILGQSIWNGGGQSGTGAVISVCALVFPSVSITPPVSYSIIYSSIHHHHVISNGSTVK